jgi:hypothetical protein
MEDLKRRAAALDERVGHLDEDLVKNTAAVDRLATAHEELVQRNDKDRRSFFAAILIVAAITGLLGYTVLQIRATNARLEVLIQQVVCPILGRSIGAYDPSRRRPEDLARYEESQKLTISAYGLLECKSPIPGPPQ